MTAMATAGTSTFFNMLVKLLQDEVLGIVQTYFELKIVQNEGGTLFNFLRYRLHELFHCFTRQPCCSSEPPCHSMSRKRAFPLTQVQLFMLLESDPSIQPIHLKKEKGRTTLHCICPLLPNHSLKISDLDLTFINCLIKTSRQNPPGNPQWIKDIIFVRNSLWHMGDPLIMTNLQFEIHWSKLEDAAVNIAGIVGEAYQEGVKRRIREMKKRQSEYKEMKIQETKDDSRLQKFLKERDELFRRPELHDISETLDFTTTNKDWFYRHTLLCNGIDVHCIVDQRLEKKYFNLNTLYGKESVAELLDDTSLSVPKSVVSLPDENLSSFEILYKYIKLRGQRSPQEMKELLVKAATQKETMICRWIMANTSDNGESNQHIENALEIALDNADRNTTKAIAWRITNAFYQTFKANLLNAHEVYPALKCECGNHPKDSILFCSRNKFLVVSSDKEIRGVPNRYKGFTIQITPYHDNDDKSEGHTLSSKMRQETAESDVSKCGISSDIAKRLFTDHSNLSLICSSKFKSRKFYDDHDVQREICIQLFCKTKGLIPFGENHFPKTIQGIPTDVIQGRAHLITTLRIGDRIGTQSNVGTLGGFVNYLGFHCFITCAHVMYDVETLLSTANSYSSVNESIACIHSSQGQINCGKVIRKIFDHDDSTKTSIDAALVYLTDNSLVNQNEYVLDSSGNPRPYSALGLASPFLNLNDSCLDHEVFCILKPTATVAALGATTKLDGPVIFENQRPVDVVCESRGSTSGSVNGSIIYPLLSSSPAHMQLSAGQLTQQRVFRMYNQMVLNLDMKSGDSGTCIYVINSPLNKTGCLGMAIAFCGGVSIVTPMKDILKRIF